MALRGVSEAIRRYDGRRGLHRVLTGLVNGTADYFRSPKLVSACGRADYSYILPALEPLLRQHEEWPHKAMIDGVMVLIYHLFHFLPDSTILLPGAPGKHPTDEFCSSEDNVVALARYAEALTKRHSDTTPQYAGHCFKIIVAKVIEDRLGNIQMPPAVKEDFIRACASIPDGVWATPAEGTPGYGLGTEDLSLVPLPGSRLLVFIWHLL